MNSTHPMIAGLVVLGLSSAVAPAHAAEGTAEKCAGVAKAGRNDCGTATSACAGTARTDALPDTWVFVPKGSCSKVVGGRVTDKPENVRGGAAAMNKRLRG